MSFCFLLLFLYSKGQPLGGHPVLWLEQWDQLKIFGLDYGLGMWQTHWIVWLNQDQLGGFRSVLLSLWVHKISLQHNIIWCPGMLIISVQSTKCSHVFCFLCCLGSFRLLVIKSVQQVSPGILAWISILCNTGSPDVLELNWAHQFDFWLESTHVCIPNCELATTAYTQDQTEVIRIVFCPGFWEQFSLGFLESV